MTRPALPLPLGLEDRLLLEDRLRSRKTSERLRLRCQIVLLGAEGLANALIASRLRVTRSTVLEWRRRFTEGGIQILAEGTCEKSHTSARMDREKQIRDLLKTPPPEGAAAWTVRALAKAAACSPATVQRMLEAAELRVTPRRSDLHIDLGWAAGTEDVVGFYLHSPYHTVALEVDPRKIATPPSLPLPAPKPGESAWLLHLHLRSLEGLRQMEARSTHYSSTFWRFLSALQPKSPSNLVWCLTDTPLYPEHLRQLEFEKEFLRITCMEPGMGWLETMKRTIIPLLQRQVHQGRCPSIQASIQALESFIRNGSQDPLQWRSSA